MGVAGASAENSATLKYEQCHNTTMKADIYNHKLRYETWKAEAIQVGMRGLSAANSETLIAYVLDMELGRNTARGSRKGARSHCRLNNLRQRMGQMLRWLQDRGVADVCKATETQVLDLFSEMRAGTLRTAKGKRYKSTGDYVRVFKAFWHWHMLVSRKAGNAISDLTEDLDTSTDQPKFVYLSKEAVDRLLPYFSQTDQTMLLFMFDSMIRSPTELCSLRACDVYERDGEVWVNVPEDASKTFGRTFNLLYAGTALNTHITENRLEPDDPLFSFSPAFFNRKLKEAAKQVFGEELSHPQGDHYKNLTMYDFRHSGAIHFRVLAKENPDKISLDAIRHRGGWSDFKMLNYYTRFIGIDGKIERQGILLKKEKHELETEVDRLRSALLNMREEQQEILETLRSVVGIGANPLQGEPTVAGDISQRSSSAESSSSSSLSMSRVRSINSASLRSNS